MTTELVYIKCDTYHALYIDGVLSDWNDYYNFDFEYGMAIAKKYPDFVFTEKKIDADWLESVGWDMPKNLSDVVYGDGI